MFLKINKIENKANSYEIDFTAKNTIKKKEINEKLEELMKNRFAFVDLTHKKINEETFSNAPIGQDLVKIGVSMFFMQNAKGLDYIKNDNITELDYDKDPLEMSKNCGEEPKKFIKLKGITGDVFDFFAIAPLKEFGLSIIDAAVTEEVKNTIISQWYSSSSKKSYKLMFIIAKCNSDSNEYGVICFYNKAPVFVTEKQITLFTEKKNYSMTEAYYYQTECIFKN